MVRPTKETKKVPKNVFVFTNYFLIFLLVCVNSWASSWSLVFLPTATLTYDSLRFGEIEDFPETSEPVWILGKEFSALTGNTVVDIEGFVLMCLVLVCNTAFFVSQRRMRFWQTSRHVCGSRTERTFSQLVRVKVINPIFIVQGLHLIINLDR